MKSFQDKVVVLTGSAGGIGFSLAKQFGLDGAKVIVSDLSEDRIQKAVAELQLMGIAARGFTCDVTVREDVESLAEQTLAAHGQVDVIVNNAGVSVAPTPLMTTDLADFKKVYDVNIFGVLNGIQVFGKLFEEQGTPAAIYNLGSENSIYPCVPSAHAYVSSKHAVLAITELLAEEMPDFVDVALIMPGFVNSEMTRGPFEGMDTDLYTGKVIEQLKAGEFYVVTHAYNKERLNERYTAIAAAYDKYAPRYPEDDEFDVRTLISRYRR